MAALTGMLFTRSVPRRPYGARRRRTAPPRRGLPVALATAALSVTACQTAPPPGTVVSGRPTSRPATPPPTISGACLVSPAEVKGALGRPVRPATGEVKEAGGCVFRFTDDTGGAEIGVESHRTSRTARDSVESSYRQADTCCSRHRIPGLGQDAVSIFGPRTGTSVLVLLGRQILIVTVGPPSIAPQTVIHLATVCANRL
jgi:hypothetical protein